MKKSCCQLATVSVQHVLQSFIYATMGLPSFHPDNWARFLKSTPMLCRSEMAFVNESMALPFGPDQDVHRAPWRPLRFCNITVDCVRTIDLLTSRAHTFISAHVFLYGSKSPSSNPLLVMTNFPVFGFIGSKENKTLQQQRSEFNAPYTVHDQAYGNGIHYTLGRDASKLTV